MRHTILETNYMKRLVFASAVLVVSLACADATGPGLPTPVGLTLQPKPLALDAVGRKASISAVAVDAAQRVVPLTELTWSTSAPAVATVDASGSVTAVGEGDAIIRAVHSSTVKDSVTVTVRATILFSARPSALQNGYVDTTTTIAQASIRVQAKP